MAKSNSPNETELSPEEEENLREQGESDEPLDTQVEDEPDTEDDLPIDETQRNEEQTAEAERGKVKTVPHQALHEERERRKALEGNFHELNTRYSRLEGRMAQILDGMRGEQEQEQIPDRETQPFEYMAYLEKRLSGIEQGQRQSQQRSQQDSQVDAVIEQGNSLAATYRSQVGPEIYDSAFQFVYNQRGGELKDMGYPDHQIQRMLNEEVRAGIVAAMQNRINPGEMLFNMAKRRGYQVPQAQPNGKGGKQEAVDRAKSLGGGAEKKLVTAGSVADIARMTDDEFAEWHSKNGMKGMRKAFLG